MAQIDPRCIMMAVFGLVTDHENRAAFGPAAPQESVDPLEHHRIGDARPINVALQSLPRAFAVGQKPNAVADRLLGAGETLADQAATARGAAEDLIVADEGVVEIDPDPQQACHPAGPGRSCPRSMIPFFIAVTRAPPGQAPSGSGASAASGFGADLIRPGRQ